MLHISTFNFFLCFGYVRLRILIVFNDNSCRCTEKMHKLKVDKASKLCLGYIHYVQYATPKEGWRPLVFGS